MRVGAQTAVVAILLVAAITVQHARAIQPRAVNDHEEPHLSQDVEAELPLFNTLISHIAQGLFNQVDGADHDAQEPLNAIPTGDPSLLEADTASLRARHSSMRVSHTSASLSASAVHIQACHDVPAACPNSEPMRQRRVPTINGCGLASFPEKMRDILSKAENVTRCCNLHDVCYGTIGSVRAVCDSNFKGCIDQYCEAKGGVIERPCKFQARAFYEAVHQFGCDPYRKTQERCGCP